MIGAGWQAAGPPPAEPPADEPLSPEEPLPPAAIATPAPAADHAPDDERRLPAGRHRCWLPVSAKRPRDDPSGSNPTGTRGAPAGPSIRTDAEPSAPATALSWHAPGPDATSGSYSAVRVEPNDLSVASM